MDMQKHSPHRAGSRRLSAVEARGLQRCYFGTLADRWIFAEALELNQTGSELEPDVVVQGQQYKVSTKDLTNAQNPSILLFMYNITVHNVTFVKSCKGATPTCCIFQSFCGIFYSNGKKVTALPTLAQLSLHMLGLPGARGGAVWTALL